MCVFFSHYLKNMKSNKNRIKYWFCNLVCTNSQEHIYLKRVWTQERMKVTSFLKKVNWVWKQQSQANTSLVKVAKCIKVSFAFYTMLTHTNSFWACVYVCVYCIGLYTLKKAVIASNSCIQNARQSPLLNNSGKVTPLNSFWLPSEY